MQPSVTEQNKKTTYFSIIDWQFTRKNRQNWLPNENLVCAERRQQSKSVNKQQISYEMGL